MSHAFKLAGSVHFFVFLFFILSLLFKLCKNQTTTS